MTSYPKCPVCGGTVVPHPVLPDAKVPKEAEFVCMTCDTPFRRENGQLVKLLSTTTKP